jgi:alpha-beta hydrolase superfamily lysophospholipase
MQDLRLRALCVLTAAACFLQGCSSLPLEPWHTVQLSEEFRASRADEIRSFEDYLHLEDRLFAQLDAKVYARTPAGPDTALLRYSKGSASDPQGREPNWNRSFELPAAAPVGAVLLLHGMSDSPYSLRALGEELNRRHYWVVGLRLPGHGTAPSGLLNVHWEDMAAAVQLAAGHLAQKVGKQPLHIIGYSTGAPLALDFTLNALDGRSGPVPSSLVLVSPAIGIHAAAAAAAWKRRLAVLPGLGDLAWLNVEPEFDPYKYNSFTTNAGEQVHRLTQSVSRRVASRARAQRVAELPPILVFKSNADSTVSTDAVVSRLLGLLDPQRHELVLFDVNREAAKSVLLVADRRALTNRVMGDSRLPFAVTLVSNENEESAAVVARHQAPFSADVSQREALNMAWPPGTISLSHVALPIPPDDPLYGQRPPGNRDVLFLGQMAILGERGTLVLPAEWLLRLRHNPFYAYVESRTLAWIAAASGDSAGTASPAPAGPEPPE